MQTLEDHIVACARGWLGTRFHHQGRLKKAATHAGGVDCLGLLAGIAEELDIKGRDGLPLSRLDRADYGHLPDGKALQAALSAHLCPVTLSDITPGSVLLIALENVPRHLAIVTDLTIPGAGVQTGMLHAYAQARKVVEHALDRWWRERIAAVFRIPEQS